MATPEIKSRQLNPAELQKLQGNQTSMPKADFSTSDTLSSDLSGSKGVSFGGLSAKNSSLASSLESKPTKTSTTGSLFGTKSGSSEVVNEPTDNTSGAETTASDFSIYEQLSLKSKVSTTQSEIITAKNSSIFTQAKAGSSASSAAESAAAIDTSHSEMARTYIGAAKDLVSQAESAYNNGNYQEAINYYTQAQKELDKAQSEMIKAQNSGDASGAQALNGDVNSLLNQCSTGKSTVMSSVNYTAYSGYSGGSNKTSFGQQFMSQLPQALVNGTNGAATGMATNMANKAMGSNGTLNKAGASEEAQREIRPEEAKFDASVAKARQLEAQRDTFDTQVNTAEDKISELQAKVDAEGGELKTAFDEYEKTKRAAFDNKSATADKQYEVNQKEAIVETFKEQEKALEPRAAQEARDANIAEKKASAYETGELATARSELKAAQGKLAAAATPEEQEKLKIEVEKAQAKVIKAEKELERLQAEATAKREKADATQKELENIRKNLPQAEEDVKTAQGELEKLKDNQEKLDHEAEIQEESLKLAKGNAKEYKNELDKLMTERNKAAVKVSDLNKQIEVENMKQDYSQETVDKIIKKYDDKKPSKWNPMNWF